MNHLAARQIASDDTSPDAGKWRYTTHNPRGGTYAIGYCSPLADCPNPSCHLGRVWDSRHPIDSAQPCTDCGGQGYVRKPDPCPGHDTADEARVHYRQYLLAERTSFDVECAPDEQHQCVICATWTQRGASVAGSLRWYLCDDHRTPAHVAFLLPAVGESWES